MYILFRPPLKYLGIVFLFFSRFYNSSFESYIFLSRCFIVTSLRVCHVSFLFFRPHFTPPHHLVLHDFWVYHFLSVFDVSQIAHPLIHSLTHSLHSHLLTHSLPFRYRFCPFFTLFCFWFPVVVALSAVNLLSHYIILCSWSVKNAIGATRTRSPGGVIDWLMSWFPPVPWDSRCTLNDILNRWSVRRKKMHIAHRARELGLMEN